MATLGRYELRDRLGRGGFATVFRAWDPRLRREVAIKALSLDWSDDEDVRRRFLVEAQSLANLQHPNLVTVHDVGDTDERPYFAMELVDGQTLADALANEQPFALEQAVEIATCLAGALDAVHAARLVHRDVKAANIMLSRNGRVVLMDLGIARLMESPQVTSRSLIMLSPEGAAPEQIRGEVVGPAADIYALGVVTYQMLAGRAPFTGDTGQLLYDHVHTPPPPLWDLRPDLPGGVFAVVLEALAKDPARRPAGAGVFARALAEAVGGHADVHPSRIHMLPLAAGAESLQAATAHPPLAPTVAMPASALDPAPAVDHPPSRPPAPTSTDPAAGRRPEPDPGPTLPFPHARTRPSPAAIAAPSDAQAGDVPSVGVRRAPMLWTRRRLLGAGAGLAALGLTGGALALRRREEDGDGLAVRVFAGPARAGRAAPGYVDGAAADARFSSPSDVTEDAAGNLYIADKGNDCIRKISPDGTVSTLAGFKKGYADGMGKDARFDSPEGLTVDAGGNLYVSDSGNLRIRKVTPRGEVTTLAGSGERGLTDGPATTARIHAPAGLCVDADGNVYFADPVNHRIRKISAQGVSTIAGAGPADGYDEVHKEPILNGAFADGPADAARFNTPTSVAIDSAGNLYVADSGNHRIRRITPQGIVTTVAGGSQKGGKDGTGSDARFDSPWALTLDGGGNLYVAEIDANRVRMITPDGWVSTLRGAGRLTGANGVAIDAAGNNLYVAEESGHRVTRISLR